MSFRFFVSLLLGLSLYAADQPPAESEAALRQRVLDFYNCYISGKYRQALPMVADDSMDAFLSSDKPKLKSFALKKIDFSEGAGKAVATLLVEREVMAPGIGKLPMKTSLVSHWKLTEGNWMWYLEPDKGIMSPMGVMMKPGPSSTPGRPAGVPDPKAVLAQVQDSVKADRTEISLSAKETASQVIVLRNTAPGNVAFDLADPQIPGLTLVCQPKAVGPQQIARLVIRWTPGSGTPPSSVPLSLRVKPTGQTIPVQIKFQ